MKLEQTMSIYAGGQGSGCRGDNCGRKPLPKELYNGMLVQHAKEALTKGLRPRNANEYRLGKVYTTTDKDRALGYGAGYLEIVNDQRADRGLKPINQIALVVVKDKDGTLRKQLHKDSSEDEHVFKGKIDKKHIDRIEIWDVHTDKIIKTLKAGGQGSGCHGANCGRPVTNPKQVVNLHRALLQAMQRAEGGKELNTKSEAYRQFFHKHHDALGNFINHTEKLVGKSDYTRKARDYHQQADNNAFKATHIAMGNVKSGFNMLHQALQKHTDIHAAEEDVEMEGKPIRPMMGKKTIKQVGTQFCVIGDGVDKNQGCYPSREKANAVANNKSFIEPDIDAGQFGDTGWQYGRRLPVGYVRQRNLSGFPGKTATGVSRKPNPSGLHVPQAGKMNPNRSIRLEGGGQGSGCHGPNCGRPSEAPEIVYHGTTEENAKKIMKTGLRLGKGWHGRKLAYVTGTREKAAVYGHATGKQRFAIVHVDARVLKDFSKMTDVGWTDEPVPAKYIKGYEVHDASASDRNKLLIGTQQLGAPVDHIKAAKKIKSYADYGEPMAGAMQHGHIDPRVWFHPPSLKNPDHVPTDDPGEKNNRFLDVDKRKAAHKDRMKLLKRSTPGGQTDIPVHTTLLNPHMAAYMPQMSSASSRKPAKTRPVDFDHRRRRGMFVSYDRQGCL